MKRTASCLALFLGFALMAPFNLSAEEGPSPKSQCAPLCCTSSEHASLKDSLGPVNLGMKAEDLIELVGEPIRKGEVVDFETGETIQAWVYEEGVTIEMSGVSEGEEPKVYGVNVTSPSGFESFGGITIGMVREEALAILKNIRNSTGQLHEDNYGASVIWADTHSSLNIRFTDNKVATMYTGPGSE